MSPHSSCSPKFRPTPDFVFTLAGKSKSESCPIFHVYPSPKSFVTTDMVGGSGSGFMVLIETLVSWAGDGDLSTLTTDVTIGALAIPFSRLESEPVSLGRRVKLVPSYIRICCARRGDQCARKYLRKGLVVPKTINIKRDGLTPGITNKKVIMARSAEKSTSFVLISFVVFRTAIT